MQKVQLEQSSAVPQTPTWLRSLNRLAHSAKTPWYLGPYFLFVVCLTLMVFAYPSVQSTAGLTLLRSMLTLLMVASVYVVANRPWVLLVVAILIIPSTLGQWMTSSAEHPNLNLASQISALTLLGITIVAMLQNVIGARRVTTDVIFGSIAIYLLAGIWTALGFMVVHTLDPGSVIATVTETSAVGDQLAVSRQFAEFLYFSFVTLTSVGYGDLSPLGSEARSLAVFEGIFGQLYVAILIGKLVGMYASDE